ncbi:ABC transporter ATP-binding protein [Lactobacillus sp. Sy-1]|uniref:ABC transporter ATP-binding protein n=1 Tax=Lactobacillus sp. Sy-1 TaxID=2109645 RepID=UPI001C5BB0BB|nr:ABC transporter ATP-binding protein [Lactobacillus sp. Sy-1]MBW1605854.1 ABC transporter ATP-binding protein [Lactobacillus sp. Sy-1]
MPKNNFKKGQRADNFWQSTFRLVRYLKPWRISLISVFIMVFFSVALDIVTPKMLGEATTIVFEGVSKGIKNSSGLYAIDFSAVVRILIFTGSLFLISGGLNIGVQRIMATLSQKVVYRLRKDLKAKMERLPVSFYDQHSKGDIMSRAVNDMDNISTMLQSNLSQLINSIVLFLGVIVMMLTISWQLTLGAFVTVPLSLLAVGFLAPRSQRYFTAQQKHLGQVNGQVEENFAGHNVVKTFNREQDVIEDFEKQNEAYYNSAWKAQFISSFMFPMMNFIKNLDYVFVAIIGAVQVISGSVTIGNVQAFLQYTDMFSQPITSLANITNTIQSTIASAERIFEVLDEPEMKPSDTSNQNRVENGDKIQFSNVDFRYDPKIPLIDGFNLDVPKGSSVAIVGPTGAGKTTIINLLERFYDVDGGSVRLDGLDTQHMTRPELRSHIAMVLQDTWLFTGTIFDNIKYGNANASDADVYKASKEAHADEFIRKLPDGYDTILNESASNISQGQRQLLTIARAFIANPEILILDEATSSVDTRTEMLIQHAMDSLIKGRTSFVVAHRLSTIQNSDKIVVMNQGHIIETGNHNQLLAKNGFYADLYNAQFAGNDLKAQ